jgi:hypothetical protein
MDCPKGVGYQDRWTFRLFRSPVDGYVGEPQGARRTQPNLLFES